jgi:serine protease Do
MLLRSLSLACVTLVLCCLAPVGRAESLPDFTQLAEDNSPAVVNIGTTVKHQNEGGPAEVPPQFQIPDLPEDSPLNEFFRKFFGEGGGMEGPESLDPQTSLGSGFIISKDGYVITNYHVVKDADEVIVTLSDRRQFPAKVIGSDERSDLAVLKIDADNLPVVKLGDSTTLKVGEWVLAIGSPFGFDYSVTAGIVSAKGRSLPSESYVPFIQTDVAINPGNSGGPLFNLRGEVVGVNSQIYSRTGGFMGLSFAIPVEVVVDVYQQLKDKGVVVRGWLGVLIQDVTRDLAESFGMDRPRGALVAKVLPDGPATEAGIQPGDIIVEFNGKQVSTSSDLPPMVGNAKVGDRVPVKVIRNGNSISLEMTIGELPKEEELKLSSKKLGDGVRESRLDVSVKDLSKKQREMLEIAAEEGVVVEQVGKGPAAKAGIRKGDIILRIDNQPVKDTTQFKELVAALPAEKSIPVLIQRQGNPTFLAIKLPKK